MASGMRLDAWKQDGVAPEPGHHRSGVGGERLRTKMAVNAGSNIERNDETEERFGRTGISP
jgi:hypothetical protein